MKGYVQSATATWRVTLPIYTQPRLLISKLLSMTQLPPASQFPDQQQWIDAYNLDPDLLRVCNIVRNPAALSKDTLKDIPFNYHSALRQALIMIDNDMLIYRKPIAGGMSYTKLILVLSSLRNILFIAAANLMPTGHYIVFVFVITGWGCTPTLNKCDQHALVAPFRIPQRASQASWCTISRMRHLSWSFT
jgi:hypothetical protein